MHVCIYLTVYLYLNSVIMYSVFFFPVKTKTLPVKKPQKIARESTKLPVKSPKKSIFAREKRKLPVKLEKKSIFARERRFFAREKTKKMAKNCPWKTKIAREKIEKKAKNGFHGQLFFSREKDAANERRRSTASTR